jgi:hypothetical protein
MGLKSTLRSPAALGRTPRRPSGCDVVEEWHVSLRFPEPRRAGADPDDVAAAIGGAAR